MFRKNKLIVSIILIALITASALLLFFLYGGKDRYDNAYSVDSEETMNTTTDRPVIDYTRLDSVLEKVPEDYTIFFDEAIAVRLGNLLNDVELKKSTMTQETADSYAEEIGRIIQSYDVFSDAVQVYIKVSDEELISKEYSEASIAIIDSKDGNHENITDLSAQIKIRGNSTTEVAKKSYTIKLSQKEDVLGMGKAKKWVLNANAFDKTLMRNKLVFDFANKIGLKYTPESEFADVWLNGRFLGNYLLSEVVEASPSRVDIDTDQGDFLIEREVERYSADTTYFTTPVLGLRFGVAEPKDITKEQLETLTDFLGKVEAAMKAGDWEAFTSYVDEKTYIDYYIMSELFKVVDFDYSSTRFYIKDGKLYAGPSWDNDLSSGNADSEFYYNYNYNEGYGPDTSYIGLWCKSNFYSNCFEFPEFTKALKKRYQELSKVIVNLYQDNSLGTNQIDLLLAKYCDSFERNYTTAEWTLTQDFILERIPEATYDQNVEYLRGWLEKRNEYLLDNFE